MLSDESGLLFEYKMVFEKNKYSIFILSGNPVQIIPDLDLC